MIFSPTDRNELMDWLCTRSADPFTVRGTSGVGSDGDQVVMSGLNKIILYEPDEMIIQCESGVTLAELEQTLARHAQWIPTLRASEDECTTLGGALSLDIYHPRAATTQSLRTTVLGGTFATTSGTVFKSGSRVVKSVAGYDTHRSMVGARGTIAIIIQVTLRVLPRPEQFFRFLAPRDAKAVISRLSPLVLEEMSNELLVELAGYREDIEEDRALLQCKGINTQELSEADWNRLFRGARATNAPTIAEISPRASDLLNDLRTALDPTGVLR